MRRLLAMVFITTPLLVRSFIPNKQVCPITFPTRTSLMRMSSNTPSTATTDTPSLGKVPDGKDPKKMSDEDWLESLTPQEFNVLRARGTEYPGTGIYDRFYPKEGYFACAACGNPIYSAESKFKSGCGWPAFDKCYKGSLDTKVDLTFGVRIELMCSKCGGHLGHVFEGERMTNTNERHCVNSVSMKYVNGAVDKEEDKLL